MRNVLVIGDPHEPFTKKGYLDFCCKIRDKYKCSIVHCTGDLIDNHAASFHTSDPDGFGAGPELELARKHMKVWARRFPKLYITIGNHDRIPQRKAFEGGVPAAWIKGYNDVLGTPSTWKWELKFERDGVLYKHGTGNSGKNAALNLAMSERKSVVIGHIHSFGGVQYSASTNDIIFGLNAGCGIDPTSYAAAYGRDFRYRPTIGCGVVLENGRRATFIPMPL